MTQPPSWNPGDAGNGAPRRRSVMPGSSQTPPNFRPAQPPARRPAQAPAAQPSRRDARGSGSGSGGGGRGGGGRGGSGPAGRKRFIDYPRSGKRGLRRWLPSWRLVLGTFATLGALAVGAFAYLYATTDIPKPDDFAQAQTTTVYYADGTTQMGTFGVQNRVIVGAEEIPQVMKDAVVAGEDRTFYENPGIDPIGILRALYTNLRYGERQGGSSITQQYAERYYFSSTVSSYSGKIKEAILAIKLDRAQDKDEIVSNYLNTIYFGRDSYGIETAARAYFGVSAKDLTLTQSALIAGVIPSPNNFDPRISPEQAERRWNYVLDGMVAIGKLDQAERDAQVFPQTVEWARSDTYAGTQGYLLDMVRKELTSKAGITEEQLDQRGYSIITTIDPTLQAQLEQAVAEMPADHAPNLRVAGVTLDPTDSAILALYGGPDYLTQARNAVTQDVAQAGSTFKAFTLTAYLENGGSLKSRYSGKNRIAVEGFPDGVRNYGDESFGVIDVVKATADSVNAVYGQMNVEVGPDKTLEVAERAGVPASALENQDVPANVLGTASPHPLDMAEAYNTFASGGLHSEPFIVRSVTYLDGGETAYQGGVTPERVFDQDVMADVTYALQQVTKSGGTAKQVSSIGYPVAGKTGTSNENRSAWFVGFTHQLTTAVALYQVGADGSQESITAFGGYRYITGGSVPADLWTAYMTNAMAGRESVAFPPPAYVGTPNTPPQVAVPDLSGMTQAQAETALGGVGLTAAFTQANDPTVPEGTVVSSNPAAGTEVDEGSTVTVVISMGPGTTAIPDVSGMSVDEATAAIEGAGFAVTVVEEASDSVPAGEIIGIDPGSGTQAAPGATVTITVSSGPPPPDPGNGGGGGNGGG